jgi:hypothetical protein
MRTRTCNKLRLVTVGLALIGTSDAVVGQYFDPFEAPSYNATVGGVALNGQNGWYNPDPPTSVSGMVFTYAGNALGLPAHTQGGEQFVGLTGPGGDLFARSQRDVSFASRAYWVSFDVAVTYTGTLPAGEDIGAISTEPLTLATPGVEAGFMFLGRWVNPTTADNWRAEFVYWNSANEVQVAAPCPMFERLVAGRWYLISIKIAFDTNEILRVSIHDTAIGYGWRYYPSGWFLGGGLAGGLPLPTALRLVAGSATVAGSTMVFDNLGARDASGPLCCVGDITADCYTDLRDLGRLLPNFGGACQPLCGSWQGDLNCDGVVDLADLGIMLADFGCGL